MNDFVDYVRMMLGASIINIELTDDQILQTIEDSLDIFNRYTYGEATYRDTIIISISAGVSAYQLDSTVNSVLDISKPNGDDINKLFTPQHELLYSQFQNGSFLGTGGGEGNLGGGYAVGNYVTTLTYMTEIDNIFEKSYVCTFSENTNTLRIWPCPEQSHQSMLTIWRKENSSDLFNHILLKKLVRAKCMILWGLILGKNLITLPGGSTINYQMYLDRGTKEEEEAISDIKMETNPPIMLIG
jgi:hypothetical protein